MLNGLVDQLAQAQSPECVTKALCSTLASRDVAYYSHRTFISPEKSINHTTVPLTWIDHYMSQRYYRFDPGLHSFEFARKPISMSFDPQHATYHARGPAQTMFQEMSSFGAKGSFFVPFRTPGPGPNASVCFLTDLTGAAFDEWVRKTGPSLGLIATLVHTKIFDMINDAADKQENPLGPRERECLCWLAKGLKGDRIAEKMSISARTVEFHLKNARTKLDVQTREQALAEAIVSGFIAL